MSDKEISDRAKLALEKHDQGYNCIQSVCCAFSDLVDVEEETLFRMTEGMGLGMGSMDGTCGAIAAGAILSGLKHSTANLEKPNSKAVSYNASRQCMDAFKELNGSVICRELKGIDTKVVLRPCHACVADAAKIIEEVLFSDEE